MTHLFHWCQEKTLPEKMPSGNNPITKLLIMIITVHMKDGSVNMKTIYDALRDLVPFVQFKKRKKHPWKSVTFRKIAG